MNAYVTCAAVHARRCCGAHLNVQLVPAADDSTEQSANFCVITDPSECNDEQPSVDQYHVHTTFAGQVASQVSLCSACLTCVWVQAAASQGLDCQTLLVFDISKVADVHA